MQHFWIPCITVKNVLKLNFSEYLEKTDKYYIRTLNHPVYSFVLGKRSSDDTKSEILAKRPTNTTLQMLSLALYTGCWLWVR